MDDLGAAPKFEDGDDSHQTATAPDATPGANKSVTKAPKVKSVSATNVSQRKGNVAKPSKSSKPAALPWTFPKNTLEDAIKIARAIEEQNGGNPMKPEMLAKAVGYNSVASVKVV